MTKFQGSMGVLLKQSAQTFANSPFKKSITLISTGSTLRNSARYTDTQSPRCTNQSASSMADFPLENTSMDVFRLTWSSHLCTSKFHAQRRACVFPMLPLTSLSTVFPPPCLVKTPSTAKIG